MKRSVAGILQVLQGLILTPEEADRIIAVTRGRTRARVHSDNRLGLSEPVLATMRKNSGDGDYAKQAVPMLLAEIDRLKALQ